MLEPLEKLLHEDVLMIERERLPQGYVQVQLCLRLGPQLVQRKHRQRQSLEQLILTLFRRLSEGVRRRSDDWKGGSCNSSFWVRGLGRP